MLPKKASSGLEPVVLAGRLKIRSGPLAAPAIPMPKIVGQEIELLGSHGMQAHRYGAMLDMVASGKLDPSRLVGDQISLANAPEALMGMDRIQSIGATVITRF